VEKQGELSREYGALERLERGSTLFGFARRLLRYGDEVLKPNGERLAEFTDSRLPQLKQGLLNNRPIEDELEVVLLTHQLTKLREALGADHPVVKRVLGARSPAQVAAAAVKGTRLKDLKADRTGNPVGGFRKELFDGKKETIDAARDPMIELARAMDPEARAIRKRQEAEVEGPLKRQQELLARARFAVYGQGQAPDATFTLRLSYGSVKGYSEHGQQVSPITALGGAFTRATGADPYALPPTWLAAKGKLTLDTPYNVATTNDIIGGNSGSPLVNPAGEVVGLIFDGNIQSLGGDYGFDESVNRAVAVTAPALLQALDLIYGARRLVTEIKAGVGVQPAL
jgi:hypothetical protein